MCRLYILPGRDVCPSARAIWHLLMAGETVMATVYITAASPSPPAPLLPHCPKMPLHQGGNQKKGGSLYSTTTWKKSQSLPYPNSNSYCPTALECSYLTQFLIYEWPINIYQTLWTATFDFFCIHYPIDWKTGSFGTFWGACKLIVPACNRTMHAPMLGGAKLLFIPTHPLTFLISHPGYDVFLEWLQPPVTVDFDFICDLPYLWPSVSPIWYAVLRSICLLPLPGVMTAFQTWIWTKLILILSLTFPTSGPRYPPIWYAVLHNICLLPLPGVMTAY